jgi:hypothetical protein
MQNIASGRAKSFSPRFSVFWRASYNFIEASSHNKGCERHLNSSQSLIHKAREREVIIS